MKPTLLATVSRCAGRLACGLALLLASSASAAQFTIGSQTFTVPDGFIVELAAPAALVPRPITADFDEQGRLYVADSSGSNDKVEKQLADKPHRIVRLEDTDGDGRFDKSVVFADKMMFPEGTMWLDGSLFVAAPPSIWKLTDTNHDGVADARAEWFQGKTLTGCANDLHGPYAGPDGWIYWCKGAFAKQTHQLASGRQWVTRAAHIFRARPDGTGIEAVMTGGMDNPVDVAFTPGGERIFTTTFFQHPGGGQRDGLIHAIYGGVYGKPHDVLDDHPKTGDLMPVLTHMGPAAPCGFTRYESRAFGAGFQDNFFACQFNLHKVSRHVLTPDGATFKSRDEDFLVCDHTDFHPTDVLEDADGSLLVVDTGGWYKLCCPTSQLYKPDVLGAIYRVRRQGAPRWDDPRGLKLAWAALTPARLCGLLDDERPAVRARAINELGRRGEKAVAALASTLRKAPSAEVRRQTVWALTRIEGQAAREAVRRGLADKDPTVRTAAAHSISVWRDSGAVPELRAALERAAAPVQRVAAEALGRLGANTAVPALLAAAARQPDRALEHSLTFALIEIADRPQTERGLAANHSFTRRAALIALDQMDGGGLKPEQVVPLLNSADPVLKQTAFWIVGRHPDWGGALAGFFGEQLVSPKLSDADRSELQRHLARFTRDEKIQDLLAATVANAALPPAARLAALKAMTGTALKQAPRSWLPALEVCLRESAPPLRRAAIAAARTLPPAHANDPDLTPALLRVARDASQPADLRLEALAALPSRQTGLDADLFPFTLAAVSPDRPLAERAAAAAVLGRQRLTDEQLVRLTDALKGVGPLEVPRLLGAFERGTNEAVGLRLLASLKEAKGLAAVRPEVLRPRLTNFPAVVRQKGEELLASLNTDAAQQKARLDALLGACQGGDVRRGQALFNGAKTACSSCHTIGYLGGNLGPDLTRIGQVRTERDLLESIVFPSASFVRSYEPVVVVTRSGDEHSGVLRKDAPDEVVLGTGANVEVRVPRAEIAEMRPGSVSVMPQGLDEQLTPQELADLLAFLKATRW